MIEHTFLPWPKLVRDTKGLHVVTLRDIETGWQIVPAGTVAVVSQSSQWSNLAIATAPCVFCGVRVIVKKLDKNALQPIAAA
jgi:hypothetical protein